MAKNEGWRSSLETCEPATGRLRVVLRTPTLIEVPNWDPDGASLLVNGDGRLWRVAVEGEPELAAVDTGFADACNNDHGISPDGTRIAIGHHAAGSTIYILPAAGGTPAQVTTRNPSYWPAGRRTGRRWPSAAIGTGDSTSSPSPPPAARSGD